MPNYGWAQNRTTTGPSMSTGASNTVAAMGSRVTDSWLPPDSDISPDSLSGRSKKIPLEDRDGSPMQRLQQSPPRNVDWNGVQGWGVNGGLTEQRMSPTSQLQSGGNRATGSAQYAPDRNRPRGPTQTSSSPVMMQAMAIRQHQLQQSPPNPPISHPPVASSSQVRGTPPSVLQGLIPPRDLQPVQQPYLPRSQSDSVAVTAAASGVRTPPGSFPTTRQNTTSPPGGRGLSTGPSTTYHTPSESPDDQTRNSYMSATSASTDFQRLPFEYDQYGQEDEDVTRPDPHGRARQDYRRDESPSQVQSRALPNPPPVQQPPPRQPQASSSVGSGFRVPMRFPVHEEVDDDVLIGPAPSIQKQPATKPVERQPSPPPAPPSQHPPIPIYSPQSVQAAAPQVLRDAHHREATPSPPPKARDGSHQKPEDELDPAVESSDNFTPKSPNVALPVDHGMSYTNTNVGRYGQPQPQHQRTRSNGTPLYNMHHSLFAMQMGGMPLPRGPLASARAIYNNSPNFTSLSGAAEALNKTQKPESPYPPPPINTDVNGQSSRTASGYGPSAESGNATGAGHYEQQQQHWVDPEHWSYQDFVDWQRRVYSSRPDAPIPPTPQSYASPQQTHYPRDPYGQDARNQNGSGNPNGSNANIGYGVPGFGNGYGPPTTFDPTMIPDRYIPSALSSYLSSPMMHNPFLPRFPPPQSLVSSPSHIPLDLPPAPMGRRLHKKKSKKHLRGGGSGAGGSAKGGKGPSKLGLPPSVPPPVEEPPRVDSTVPRDSSSEESDTDDTKKGASGPERKGSGPKAISPPNGTPLTGMETSEDEEEDEDVWLDEDSEDELDAEFHSRYIQNPSKRKRKWEQKWDAMVRLVSLIGSRVGCTCVTLRFQFQEIDRTTDSPMILLAAPSTASSPQTHVLVSRSIQRNPGRYMAHAQTARRSFLEITKLRRKEKAEAAAAERARRAAGFEQQLASIASLGGPRLEELSIGDRGSSPGSMPGMGALEKLQELPTLAAGGEDGLKQALSVALESLKQMHMWVYAVLRHGSRISS